MAAATLAGLVNAADPSSKGAWSTGVYRNLFAERGHTAAEIDAKINKAFQQLFFGDSATQSVYRVQSDSTLALVEAAGYVTSPDMGAGMLVTVMMDRPDVFQKLWMFTRKRMRNDSGDLKGFFARMVEARPPYTSIDLLPSPDGDESIATALYLASKRWNKGEYKQEADLVLRSLVRGGRGEC
jgi:oligosaccharide reducing-end xylanase